VSTVAIKDITLFNSDKEDSTFNVFGSSAVAIAIRNILLSEEGVFVNFPELNVNISNILFDQIAENDIYQLKNLLYKEIIMKIPNLSGIVLDVKKIRVDETKIDGSTAIGISILKQDSNDSYDLIVFKREGNVFVI
jgi:hypothetical protein